MHRCIMITHGEMLNLYFPIHVPLPTSTDILTFSTAVSGMRVINAPRVAWAVMTLGLNLYFPIAPLYTTCVTLPRLCAAPQVLHTEKLMNQMRETRVREAESQRSAVARLQSENLELLAQLNESKRDMRVRAGAQGGRALDVALGALPDRSIARCSHALTLQLASALGHTQPICGQIHPSSSLNSPAFILSVQSSRQRIHCTPLSASSMRWQHSRGPAWLPHRRQRCSWTSWAWRCKCIATRRA
jgi:hypothetical protein